jgi:hypothetical protein
LHKVEILTLARHCLRVSDVATAGWLNTPPPGHRVSVNDYSRLTIGLTLAGLLAVLAALGWAAWWLFGKVAVHFGGAILIAVGTALVCTVLVTLALQRASSVTGARFRGRAAAYQSALAFFLGAYARNSNRAEWHRLSARLTVFGSARVVQLVAGLVSEIPPDSDDPIPWDRISPILEQMRLELGQGPLHLEVAQVPLDRDEIESDEADESE